VTALREAGCRELALLKCTSSYPAPAEEANLRTIGHLASTFHCPVGLSDHTLGIACPVVAVSLGACLIEKHFTLSRQSPGPDSAFSLEPAEFAEMVRAVRVAEAMLGSVHYGLTPAEAKSRVFRRSLFAVADIAAGEPFTEHNVRSIRPGQGLPPKDLPQILGKRATRAIKRGEPLAWDCIN
jgi:pseudaminic acid synthase